MIKLKNILGFSEESIDLLEAVGYLSAEDLADANPEQIYQELKEANKLLHFAETIPPINSVEQWVALAKKKLALINKQEETKRSPSEQKTVLAKEVELAQEDEDNHGGEPSSFVNFEKDDAVQEMLDASPEARVVYDATLRRFDVEMDNIDKAILLTHCPPELNINVLKSDRAIKEIVPITKNKPLNLTTIRKIEDFKVKPDNPKESEPNDQLHSNNKKKQIARQQNGRKEEMLGIKSFGKIQVRGLFIAHPWEFRLGAVFAILTQLAFLVTIGGLVFFYIRFDDIQNQIKPYLWLIGLVLLFILFMYLIFSIKARCRVCNHRQFVPKNCIKNPKAHYLPIIGYIFPTAVHALLLSWFYCIYCGTAMRLKK